MCHKPPSSAWWPFPQAEIQILKKLNKIYVVLALQASKPKSIK